MSFLDDNTSWGRYLEKHTRKNALYADEVGSVMGCGEHGGLQRWQLTIAHLSYGERKLHITMTKPCIECGAFAVEGKNMDFGGTVCIIHADEGA